MPLIKLDAVDAFVVRDFDNEIPAIGIVRSAPKILQSGAKELMRAQTYQCAAFNMQYQGASAGINAAPDVRDAAITSFVQELLPQASAGTLLLEAGKGVEPALLADLTAADPRSDAVDRTIDGVTNSNHARAIGAVAAAEAAAPLDGRKVAIENFEVMGSSIATQVAERGGVVTAIATAAGSVERAEGFDIAALRELAQSTGAAMVDELAGGDASPGWKVLGADVDVLFAGSKMGLINHQGAPNVTASMLVPTGPIPYTTKAALMLERAGTTVLPDFVTTAGALFVAMPPAGDDQDQIETAAAARIGELASQVVNQEQSPILEACMRAESFLRTWRDELPFGRPFAA